LCGEIVEGLSVGEGSDQYDLHAVSTKSRSSSRKKEKQRIDPTNVNKFPNKRYFF
jgi:hypothetical protein